MRLFKVVLVVMLCFALKQNSFGQQIPKELLAVKQKLDAVETASAKATLNLDISFINMPEKYGEIRYKKGQPVQFTSDNFAFIPKRGLDFSWNNLFDHDFIAVERETEEVAGETFKTFNIIPNDDKATFAIMTLVINTSKGQITQADITTKKDGSYALQFKYEGSNPFPSFVEAAFEVEKIKIPLNFMGRDTDINRSAMREDGNKTGKVLLQLDWL
ncbi:hypothetical protein [Roseivirga pacifica]|uniref:hypothetical protein n=1 Tax=Roseivirga pacifica TaxID=1267423 RepID=UPI0020946C84|nr:hypothetical protein [Roseivirga pacifica]MCO6360614.1 hypothetical protein [Roseivirga pacifica]MCO6368503.1 hypothetical protein [Roseivirga pacifica]MCO6372645.1 hypothetical protein [Roseivirga pacifica]MCO6376703.1 hypothetical protein [Roseivirga pacifica]MCO6378017.1 hypothetical protein [Roseivirga pacifica]